LVENYIPGKLATMGLGWDDCRAINSRLVYASITGLLMVSPSTLNPSKFLSLLPSTGYGQTGPYSQAAGYDVVIEAEAGLMHM